MAYTDTVKIAFSSQNIPYGCQIIAPTSELHKKLNELYCFTPADLMICAASLLI